MTTNNRFFKHVSVDQFNRDMMNEFGCTFAFPNLPQRATRFSAGYDIYSPITFSLEPGAELKIPTGICVHMPPGEVLMIFPRSGLGFKYYTRLANTVGVIDGDYINADNEGHIFVKVRNEGDNIMQVNAGEGFCQAIFLPFLLIDGDNFESGSDRNGGFGSTNAE